MTEIQNKWTANILRILGASVLLYFVWRESPPVTSAVITLLTIHALAADAVLSQLLSATNTLAEFAIESGRVLTRRTGGRSGP